MLTAHTQTERGFTLIEMMIALAIGGIIFAAITTSFTFMRKTYRVQEEVSDMIENARVAMDIMTREIRMAGYDPQGIGITGIVWDCSLSPPVLELRMDLNGTGSYFGANEWILYRYDSTNKKIDRRVGFGSYLPLIEGIQSVTFQPLDASGNATCTDANIREVRLTIVARTPKPDPSWSSNGGYRTFTLRSVIQPRNLSDRMQDP